VLSTPAWQQSLRTLCAHERGTDQCQLPAPMGNGLYTTSAGGGLRVLLRPNLKKLLKEGSAQLAIPGCRASSPAQVSAHTPSVCATHHVQPAACYYLGGAPSPSAPLGGPLGWLLAAPVASIEVRTRRSPGSPLVVAVGAAPPPAVPRTSFGSSMIASSSLSLTAAAACVSVKQYELKRARCFLSLSRSGKRPPFMPRQ
jgi:hypothetical protein